MKPILSNFDKRRYIAYEGSYFLHQLKGRDDERQLYITKCDMPVAFEENWTTWGRLAARFGRMICALCGPII